MILPLVYRRIAVHSLILIDNECPISWKYAQADIYSNVTSDLLNASTTP
jgi:hypothetical protein